MRKKKHFLLTYVILDIIGESTRFKFVTIKLIYNTVNFLNKSLINV